MNGALELLKAHGYPVLFVTILLDQLGLPLPSVPILVAAGALVGLGYLAPLPVFLMVLGAALLGDLFWYELGRRRGARILKFLCQVSLEPDGCVQQTEGVFERYGERVLLFAKFVPGLYTVTPPVAGMLGLPWRRFMALDSLGIALWIAVYGGLGWLLREQLEWLLLQLEGVGATLLQMVLGGLALYLGSKFFARWSFLRRLRMARITPRELKELLDRGEDVLIADLRNLLDHRHDPHIIPGALLLSVDELDQRHEELPRDRDIVLYCT
jgi:membrane protein DedA with SNARE-associated domain